MTKYLMIAVILFWGCKLSKKDFQGYYVTKGYFSNEQYNTLDFSDTIVIVNKYNVCSDFRDTIYLNTNCSIKKSTRTYFPYVKIKPYVDSIVLTYQHDAGISDVVFYKTLRNQIHRDYFSNSLLNINLIQFKVDSDSIISVKEKKIENINIGNPKSFINSPWKNDTIMIEYYSSNQVIMNDNFSELIEYLTETNSDYIICLNSDKLVNESVIEKVKLNLGAYCNHNRIIESRIQNDKIVYIK